MLRFQQSDQVQEKQLALYAFDLLIPLFCFKTLSLGLNAPKKSGGGMRHVLRICVLQQKEPEKESQPFSCWVSHMQSGFCIERAFCLLPFRDRVTFCSDTKKFFPLLIRKAPQHQILFINCSFLIGCHIFYLHMNRSV